jgi:iron complex transport system permease protein
MSRHPKTVTLARVLAPVLGGVAAALALVVLVPLVGGGISLRAALAAGPWGMADSTDALVFWGTRVPRVLLGLVVGGSLAVAGLVMQAVLRNPLAEPYILGISTGASLGKFAALALGAQGVLGFALSPLFCFLGALVPMLALQALAVRRRRFSAVTVLLGGVMLNVFFSSLILLLQFVTDFTQVRAMVVWMMGALEVIGYRQVAVAAPVALACAVLVLSQTRAMNLLSLDEKTALHLGVNVRASVNLLLWAATILTSAIVAVSGPIGFVGLLVPHALRLVFGPDNRLLAPLCAVWGGVFLVACDFVGWRGIGMLQAAGLPLRQGGEIPIGVITSVIGVPVFLALLLHGRRRFAG